MIANYRSLISDMRAVSFLIIILFSYPLFYYSYKYWTPNLGGHDFYFYYRLYSRWDISNVPSPFNMRLISSGLTYLLSQFVPYVQTQISFKEEGFSQHVLFSAVALNYFFSVITSWIIFNFLIKKYPDVLFCLTTSLAYFFAHGTLFFSLAGLTDSLSIALFAAAIFLLQKRSYSVLLILAALVLQRELVILFISNVSLFYLFRDKENWKFYSVMFIAALGCFTLYLGLRFTLFYTPEYAHQLQAVKSLGATLHLSYPLGRYFSETLVDQNLLLLYASIVVIKITRFVSVDWRFFLLIIAMDAEIQLIAFAVPLTALGHYISMLNPIILIGLASETWPCLQKTSAKSCKLNNSDPILLPRRACSA